MTCHIYQKHWYKIQKRRIEADSCVTREDKHNQRCRVYWEDRWGSTSGYGRLARRPRLRSARHSYGTLSLQGTPRPLRCLALQQARTQLYKMKPIVALIWLQATKAYSSRLRQQGDSLKQRFVDGKNRRRTWGEQERREVTFFFWHTLHLPISAQAGSGRAGEGGERAWKGSEWEVG